MTVHWLCSNNWKIHVHIRLKQVLRYLASKKNYRSSHCYLIHCASIFISCFCFTLLSLKDGCLTSYYLIFTGVQTWGIAPGRCGKVPWLRPESSRAHPSPHSRHFSCCFRQLQIPVAKAQARLLVRRLPSCQRTVEHALQTITTPSALSVSCLALVSPYLSHSLSLSLRFSFLLFLLNSSKPWVNEEEVRRAARIVCLSDFSSFWSC